VCETERMCVGFESAFWKTCAVECIVLIRICWFLLTEELRRDRSGDGRSETKYRVFEC